MSYASSENYAASYRGSAFSDDSDFADLLWEEEMVQERRRGSHRSREVNLSSQIEDYLRYFK